MTTADVCYSCAGNANVAGLPIRERILLSPGWRVAHAISSDLPGWLVIVARWHVLSIAELTAEESAELGPLTWRLSRALVQVTGCATTYVAAFSEAVPHLHVHVVPRAADLPTAERGPAIFTHLNGPREARVPTDAMDGIATDLATELAASP